MKHKAQERIYEEFKDLSRDELVEYFHRQVETGSFGHLWKRSKKTHSTPRTTKAADARTRRA